MLNINQLKIVSAAMVGLILEFFDFTIYAVFALEIGRLFFPSESPFLQVMSSLAVFSVGFFMRPLGGALFGHIGDTFGRKIALTISIIGMIFSTLSMAFLPTFAQIGVLAPTLLIFLRLIQGLCVGGEGAGSSIFVLEHLNKLKPGLIGGIINSALTFGILLAMLTGLFLHTFFHENQNIWRYAFAIGGLFGLVGLYLRLHVEETPIFQGLKSDNKLTGIPIKKVFKENFRNVLLTISVGGLTGCSGYIVMTYIDIFFKSVMYTSAIQSLTYSVIANSALIIFLPIMGYFSDRLGYARTLVIGSTIAIFTAIPLFMMLTLGSSVAIISAIICISLVVAIIYAPLYPFMLALFPPEQRYSGIACSLNIGIALFGGTTSMYCLSLIKITGLTYAGAFYWIFVCAFFITALCLTTGRPFSYYLFGKKRTSDNLIEQNYPTAN